jgi:predicted GNAT family N-acyltransferase
MPRSAAHSGGNKSPPQVELVLEVPPGYSIERLDTALHRRTGFSCGVEALDKYLETQASQAQGKNISTTHVLLAANAQPSATHQIIGYVTLTPATLPLVDAPSALKKNAKRPEVQAQLIARMAVDRRCQGKKLGQFLLNYALKCCWDISKLSAFSVVLVDAKDENVKKFYIRFGGFQELSERSLRLYLPIETIGKLLAS